MRPAPESDESPSAVLAHQLRLFARRLKRRFRDQSDARELTPTQWAVLLRLEENGAMTTSALARAEGMRPQSMGAVIAALEDAGLVAGAPDPEDGRQTLLSLTDQFRAWISEGRAARQDWLLRTIDTRLSPADRARIAAAMPALLRLVADPGTL